MGVVKNLMVRIGADVRGVVDGMKTAYSSTRQATSQIRNATTGMKKSVKDSFGKSRMSVREYAESVSTLKAAYNSEVQNTERLSEKIEQMKSTYDSLKTALAGLDFSTSLSEQIKDSEAALRGLRDEAQKVKDALRKELNSTGGKDNSEKIANLRRELRIMRTAASEAELELKNLKSVAAAIGTENIKFASTAGLDALQDDIRRAQRELDVAKLKAGELEQKLDSMRVSQIIKQEIKAIGSAAAAAAGAGVSQLGNRLKAFGGAALKSIVTLPVKMLGIGRSAESSSNSFDRMARSIRNIGIIAVGLRIFRGIFGELQGIISSYISQNDALSASVSNLKAQLGQALAPAINMIVAGLQRLMPVIQTIASAINAIFSALFGRVRIATSGVRSSAAAARQAAASLDVLGFDQINKLSDHSADEYASEDLGSLFEFGEPPEWARKIAEWIEAMKAAFRAGDWEGLGRIFADGINSVVDAINAVDIGSKIGTFVNNLVTTLHSALSTIKFFDIGKKLGEMFSAGVKSVDWRKAGETIGMWVTSLPSVVVGFVQNTDWGAVSNAISDALTGVLDAISNWFSTVEWKDLGEALGRLVSKIKWTKVFSSVGTLLWEGFKSSLEVLGGFIKGLGAETIVAAISAAISAISLAISGRAIIAALGKALSIAVGYIISAIAGWPAVIIAAGAAAIAVLALWLKDGGSDVVKGFLQGITETISNIGNWLNEHVVTPFVNSFKALFGIHSPSTVMAEHGGNVIKGFLMGILEALGNIGDWINEHIVSPFLDWFGRLFGIQNHSTVMEEKGSSLITGLLSGISGSWQLITSFFDAALADLVTRFNTGWSNIQLATQTIWLQIATTLAEQLRAMGEAVNLELSNMRQQLIANWQNIHADAQDALGQLTMAMRVGFQSIRSESVKTWTNLRNELQLLWRSMAAILAATLQSMYSQFERTHSMLQASADSHWKRIYEIVTKKAEDMHSRVVWIVGQLRAAVNRLWAQMNSDANNAMITMQITISNGFNNMLGIVVGICGTIVSVVVSMCNAIIDAIRTAMAVMSAFGSFRTPYADNPLLSNMAPEGERLQTLRRSGTVVSPAYDIVGDAGNQTAKQYGYGNSFMDTLAQRLTNANGSGNSNTPMILQIYLGRKKLTEYVIQDINQITKSTGVCPIKV